MLIWRGVFFVEISAKIISLQMNFVPLSEDECKQHHDILNKTSTILCIKNATI